MDYISIKAFNIFILVVLSAMLLRNYLEPIRENRVQLVTNFDKILNISLDKDKMHKINTNIFIIFTIVVLSIILLWEYIQEPMGENRVQLVTSLDKILDN